MSVDDPFGHRSPGPATPAAPPADEPTIIDGPDVGDANVAAPDFVDADFVDADLEDSGLGDADLEDSELGDAELDDAEGNRAPGARAAAVAEFVATSFADHPDAIEIETRERGRDVSISIHADRGDIGRLIGRRGRVINAMRQVARAAGSVDGERVQLDIAED